LSYFVYTLLAAPMNPNREVRLLGAAALAHMSYMVLMDISGDEDEDEIMWGSHDYLSGEGAA
jgi:hypothetical protein